MKPHLLAALLVALLAPAACTTSHERPSGEPEEPAGLRPRDLSRHTDAPLLFLPSRYMARAILTAERPWYAASYQDEAITLYLSGTIAFVDAPDDLTQGETTPNATARGVGAWDTLNEGIRSLAWNEMGAAYTLEVECASMLDRRCTEDGFLRALAEELEVQP